LTTGGGDTVILHAEHQLATLHEQEPGTRVWIVGTEYMFHCAGRVRLEVAEVLGWEHKNVWIPEPALQYMVRRHPEFIDHVRAMSLVFANPISVHMKEERINQYRFFSDAAPLRDAQVLASSSVRTVDALIELRQAGGQAYLRAFHLSPTRKLQGVKLWP